MARMNLGSGRIYHAKGARETYKNATDLYDRAIKSAEAGNCSRAHDELTVANHDFGGFLVEFMHAVGKKSLYGFGPMSAPRMRRALSEKMSKARVTFARKCMVK